MRAIVYTTMFLVLMWSYLLLGVDAEFVKILLIGGGFSFTLMGIEERL